MIQISMNMCLYQSTLLHYTVSEWVMQRLICYNSDLWTFIFILKIHLQSKKSVQLELIV